MRREMTEISISYGVRGLLLHKRRRTCLSSLLYHIVRLILNFFARQVSTYDLSDHDDYKFRISDIVVRLGQCDGSSAYTEEQLVGEVLRVDPETGRIQVGWVDGSESDVYPQVGCAFDLLLHCRYQSKKSVGISQKISKQNFNCFESSYANL